MEGSAIGAGDGVGIDASDTGQRVVYKETVIVTTDPVAQSFTVAAQEVIVEILVV